MILIEIITVHLKIITEYMKILTICKFSGYCKYYQHNAHTCNDDDEAEAYCGIRHEFDEFVPHNKKKNMSGTNTATESI
jgi:hypothetical protein